MSGDRQAPTLGAGLRHAAALAVVGVLPLTYTLSMAARDGIDGFSPWLMIGVTLTMAVVGAIVSVGFPAPRVPEVIARIVIVLLVALAIRFTVPTPSLALEQVREGEGRLFSGAFLLALVLLAIAFTAGHALAGAVAHLATPARTVRIARERERRALVVWWWSALLQVFVVGVTPSGGAPASVLLVVCALIGLGLLADLRLRTAPPGATRPPIVAAPRQVRLASVVFAFLAIVGLAAIVTPLVPVDALRAAPSLPSWLLDWDRSDLPDQDQLDLILGDDEEPVPEDPPPTMPGRERSIFTPPWQLVAALAAVGLLVLLRPHRWRRGWRRLLSIVRRSRWLGGDEDAVGEITELEELEDEQLEPGERGRVRRALDRIRPRPRDPRSAVLYDYFHVERLLAKHEQGREGYETPHEHAVRVHVSEAHEELADLAADARFARTPPAGQAVDRSRDLRREIEQALRATRR